MPLFVSIQGLAPPTDRCCYLSYLDASRSVTSGAKRLSKPSWCDAQRGEHGWRISLNDVALAFTWLTCTCFGSFSNHGNLSHPGQHPVSIGLASDQSIIKRVIFIGTKHGKGFCKDSCGCLLNFPTFPKDQHGSRVDVSIDCLIDNVSSPWSQSTCLEFHIAKVRVPQLLLKLPWSCWLGFYTCSSLMRKIVSLQAARTTAIKGAKKAGSCAFLDHCRQLPRSSSRRRGGGGGGGCFGLKSSSIS